MIDVRLSLLLRPWLHPTLETRTAMPQFKIANATMFQQTVLFCHKDDDPTKYHIEIWGKLELETRYEGAKEWTTVLFHGMETWPVVAVKWVINTYSHSLRTAVGICCMWQVINSKDWCDYVNRFKWLNNTGFDLFELYQLAHGEYQRVKDVLAGRGINIKWAASWENMEDVPWELRDMVQQLFSP